MPSFPSLPRVGVTAQTTSQVYAIGFVVAVVSLLLVSLPIYLLPTYLLPIFLLPVSVTRI